MPRKALGWRDGGRRGPGHSRAQRGRVCPNLLSCSQLASLSSQQMWEKRGPSHQQDPRDQRSQRRRGIPLLRVGPKN